MCDCVIEGMGKERLLYFIREGYLHSLLTHTHTQQINTHSEYMGLPASSNIILAVFLSCVGLLLLFVGYRYGKKGTAANAPAIAAPQGALH